MTVKGSLIALTVDVPFRSGEFDSYLFLIKERLAERKRILLKAAQR